jgi:hypothetical protein
MEDPAMTKHETHSAIEEVVYAATFYALAAAVCTLFVYLG